MTIEQLEIEPPRAGEVAITMLASGVCRSDLHVVDGDWATEPPVVLGHEGYGQVEAVGAGVTALAPGDRVTLAWLAPCYACRRCAQGKPWLCEGSRSLESLMSDGSTRLRREDGTPVFSYLGVGTFGERTVVPESAAVPMPAELPAEVGALIGCAVSTGVGAVVNTAEVEPGAGVVVIGCGGVGLSIVMGAALAGADPIVAVDLSDEKLALAADVGATHGVRGGDGMAAEVARILPGGPDYVFEALGLVAHHRVRDRASAPRGDVRVGGADPRQHAGQLRCREAGRREPTAAGLRTTASPSRCSTFPGWRDCIWPASCRSIGSSPNGSGSTRSTTPSPRCAPVTVRGA